MDTWNRSVTGTLSIQIPAGSGTGDLDEARSLVLELLHEREDVQSASIIPADEMNALLRPWLGSDDVIADLPLPVLIDVELVSANDAAAEEISEVIRSRVPTAIIEDHRVWLNRIVGLAEGMNMVALAAVILVLGALGLIVVFATRSSLTEYTQAIDVLHIVGARDSYVAGQFSRRSLVQGVLGGFAGLVLYVPAATLIALLASRIEEGMLPKVVLPLQLWGILLALPFIMGLLSMITANITVRHILSQKN